MPTCRGAPSGEALDGIVAQACDASNVRDVRICPTCNTGVVRYSLGNMLPLPHSRPPDTGDDHGAVARLDLWGNGCSRSLDLSEPANSLAQPWQKTISSPSRVLICKAAACASHSETLRAFLPAVLPRFGAPRISARLSHEPHLG